MSTPGDVTLLLQKAEQGDRGEIFRFQAGAIGANTKAGIASCTKWLSGAVVLICAERGSIGLDDRIGQYLPTFDTYGKGDITIRQCFAMKSGLQLTPDQEKLWAPFESAVKDAAKARMEAMGQMMMRAREQGERMSPIDHLNAMAERLSRGAEDVKKIADAAKPLYSSLDDSQKHRFGMLGRMLMPEHAQAAEMMHGHMGEGERDGDE